MQELTEAVDKQEIVNLYGEDSNRVAVEPFCSREIAPVPRVSCADTMSHCWPVYSKEFDVDRRYSKKPKPCGLSLKIFIPVETAVRACADFDFKEAGYTCIDIFSFALGFAVVKGVLERCRLKDHDTSSDSTTTIT